jgi:fructan beta-fructosidase
LVVDGNVVRRATGCNSEALGRRVWNVADLRGKRGHLEIVDNETGGWGHILVDSVSVWSKH